MGGWRSADGSARVVMPLALLALATLVLVDAAADVQLSGVYSGTAVLAAITASGRRTALAGAAAVAASVASGLWHHNLGDAEWLLRVLACAGISLLAVLSAAVSHRRELRLHNTTRLAEGMLDAVAADLTSARTMREVAESFVTSGAAFLGLVSARVYVLGEDDVLRSVAWSGRTGDHEDGYDEIPLTSDLPAGIVVRTGEAQRYHSRAEIHRRLPALRQHFPNDLSLHLIPLQAGDLRGLFALTFPPSLVEEWAEDSLITSLANALGQALRRAQELEAADIATQRLRLLADVSARLTRTLDAESVLAEVGEVLVPAYADWCVVQLLRDGQLVSVAINHSDPDLQAFIRERAGSIPERTEADTGPRRAIRTGESQLLSTIPPGRVEATAVNPDHLEMFRRMGMTSALVSPLAGRDGWVGAISLMHAGSGRHFTETDVPFLEDVAHRVGLALETASTFEHQSGQLAEVRGVADAAQRAILAPLPDALGALALSARYVSAASGALVGGDLYEVVERGTSVRLLVGDVRGKGLPAVRAATIVMGEFRAAAGELDDLTEVARQMDRRIRSHLGEEDFVTACLVEVGQDGRYLVASCGHPAPVVSHDGALREVTLIPSLPLGLGSDPVPTRGTLAAGERLVLFTDGLFEARTPAGGFVELMDMLDGVAVAPLDTALDDVLLRLRTAAGGQLSDDLALLLVEHAPGR